MKDHLGSCQLYLINLSSYSILKLTGMDEWIFVRHSIDQGPYPNSTSKSGSVKNESRSVTLVPT